MADLSLAREDVRLLVELGFAAVARGRVKEAAEIFEGVRIARPQEEAGFVGLAMTLLASDKISEAVALLRRAPPSDSVLAFLGIALARHGDAAAAAQTLETVARSQPESEPARLAAEILAELRGEPEKS